VTAYDLAGNIIASPTITNIATGVYKVSVTQDDLEDMIFRIVPHADDQANFDDVAVMQEKVYHVADDILVDTGITLPASIATVDEDVWTYSDRELTMSATEIISAVSGSSISQVRGNTWDFEITGVVLDSNKQQFVIKRSAGSSDANALLFIDSDDGLLRLNGVAIEEAEQAKATLTYSAAEEKLTIHVDADINAELPADTWKYGAQGIAADGDVSEPYQGDFVITADIVRATE
jgi:hypothetical protein